MKLKHIKRKRKSHIEEIKLIAEPHEAKLVEKLYWAGLFPPHINISFEGDIVSLVMYPIHYVEVECPTCGQKILKNLMRTKK